MWYNILYKIKNMKSKKINIENKEITIKLSEKDNDYISLTDMARFKNPLEPKDVVKNWMRKYSTIEFLSIWEKINNPNFKGVESDSFKQISGSNSFTLSPQLWIEKTNAIGIVSKSGRYDGGTFAHKDIAFESLSKGKTIKIKWNSYLPNEVFVK